MKPYCLLTCITLLFATNTASNVSTAIFPIPIQNKEDASTYAVKTKWYYRTYNGIYQKRLWSFTENKWLTDWINVRQ